MKNTPAFSRAIFTRTALALAAVSLLTACGGGGGGGGGSADAGAPPPPAAKPAVQTYAKGSISGFGSVVVNGVRYDESKAVIRNEEGATMQASDLKLGMVVEIVADPAQKNSDGVMTAQASQVHYRNELEGPVSAVSGQQLTILGQTVLVNNATVFEDGREFSMQAGKVLEVYGQRNASGQILASRIEVENDADSSYELRSAISALNTAEMSFRMGELTVSYKNVQQPVDALANNDLVEVKLSRTPDASGQWLAIRLKKETPLALVQNIIASGTGVRADLEGFITHMDSPARFVVNGVNIDASAARILPAGLAVGSLVEVEGSLVQGVLHADEVELEDDLDDNNGGSFEVEGIISRIDPDSKTFELRGLTVDYSTSRFEDGTVNNLRSGVEVEVKGSLSSDGKTIKAVLIEFDD